MHVLSVALFAGGLFAAPLFGQKADPPAAKPPGGKIAARTMLHPDDLFIGPAEAEFDGEFRDKSGRAASGTRKVRLLLVTKSRVVFQWCDDKGVAEEEVVAAENEPKALPQVRAVTVKGLDPKDKDAKEVWRWKADGKEGAFAGEVRPPEPPALTPAKWSDDRLERYLVLRSEAVHLGLARALAVGDDDGAKWWKVYAAELKGVAEARKFPRGVCDLFDVDGSAKRRLALLEKMADEKAALRDKKVELDKQAAAAQRRYSAAATGATATGLLGGLSFFTNDSWSDWDGTARRSGAALMGSAVDDLVAAGRRRDEEQAGLSEKAELYGKQAVQALKTLREDYRTEEAKLAEQRAAQWKRLEPKSTLAAVDDLARDLVASKDVAAAAEVFEARNAALAKADLFDPVSHCTYLRVQGENLLRPTPDEKDRRKNADAAFRLARDGVAAASRVPAGDEFATDRAEVLVEAARLVHHAVAYAADPTRKTEGGPKGWARAFDPRADYGVRVCDLALNQVGGTAADRGGGVRAVRTWLLLQRGLAKEALAEGQKVEKLREGDPYTQANLARVYAVNGERERAEERFEQAVKVGFADLKAVARDPDFAAVRSASKLVKWAHYAEPNLSVVVTTTTAGRGGVASYSAEITNKGTLPLVDAQVICGSGKGAVALKVPYLAPGKAVPWMNICPTGSGLTLKVNNDRQKDYTLPNKSVVDGTFTPRSWGGWWGW